MKHLGIFNTKAEIENAVKNELLVNPYIALYSNNTKLDFNKTINYLSIPLTFEAISSGSLYFYGGSSSTKLTIEYKLNNGSWTSVISSNSGNGTLMASLSAGDKLYVRGNNSCYYISSQMYKIRDDGNLRYNLSGNMMSLINSTSFKTLTSVPANAFNNFFNGNTGLISAKNLQLPATTLGEGCYSGMFFNCSNLIEAPELPAPTLSATCYGVMFLFCTSLRYIKCLATDISAENCTNFWTNGVSSSGTFIKASGMNLWQTNENGIPSGWTVEEC